MAYANLRATRANESGSFDSQQARARITGERERERERRRGRDVGNSASGKVIIARARARGQSTRPRGRTAGVVPEQRFGRECVISDRMRDAFGQRTCPEYKPKFRPRFHPGG
jgi:hypothetical protein